MQSLNTPVRSYRDLIVWQKAMRLAASIYRLTGDFPKSELYGLTAQLRRAAISVPSNIAEGQGRISTGEFRQFLGHSRGSLLEVETQILLAQTLGYVVNNQVDELLKQSSDLGKSLNGLLRSLPQRRDH